VATPIAAHGYSPEIHDRFVGVPIALPAPPSAEVVYTDRSRASGNVLETMEMTGCVNSVMVPIVVDGAVLAWISADVTHDASRLRPSRELEERLHGLAAQASTAMHNTLLLERVSHQAEHDSLTGLPNRKVLVDRLVDAPEPATAVLFVDLDDFKDVNDGLGHHAGDILLCQVAERLRAAVRDRDMVARLGGDEFAVLVFDPKPGAGQHVAQRVIQAFDEPFDLLGQRVNISASVGIAEGGVTPDELLRSADVAMYRAKAAGKGRMALFEPGMDHAAGERLSLHADLANAITAGQLRLLYQPVLDLADGSLRGGEALVRWQHPELGLLTPDRFIGLAEDTGLIGMLGKWVLDEACEQALSWPDDVAIAVNVSPRQLDDPGIVLEVAAALERTGILPRRLILEITETVLAHDADTVVPRLHELRALGVRIAVDDFGTGYSSLGALVHLPVDILKIDRAFITGMLQQEAAADLVQVLIDMGRTLGLDVVAEGIEEMEQALALADRHCQLGQGFLYSRPVPAVEFAAFFSAATS
jgi:diguanylate cyclase (GGDEF)-like protein